MSLHPSLKIDAASTQQRSVLTRIERIKDLMKKGLWQDERSVLGLPKVKVVKIKTRKAAKEAPAEGTPEAAAAGAAPAAGAPAGKAAGASAAKAAPAKK